MSKRALTVLAINQAAIFQVAQGEPNCNTADVEAPAELMFTRNSERTLFASSEDFFRNGSYKACTGGRRTL